MCDGLRKLNTRLLQKSSQAPFLEKDLFAVLGEFIQETQHLRFEGNAYVPQWQTQAEERGLAVCAASSQAFEVFLDEQKTKVLQNCGVFSQNELASRFVLEMQKNIEQNCVECACAIDLAQSQILPACIEYSHTLLQHLHHSKSAGLPQGGITQFAQEFQDILSSMCTALNSLKLSFEKVKQAAHFASNALDARKDLVFVARQIHDTLKPQLHALRVAVDAAEARVPQKLWPILKYSTLLLDQK
jgi:glutamine synthetase